jgi:hypothetical protein
VYKKSEKIPLNINLHKGFLMKLIKKLPIPKEISRAEYEYIIIPPPLINALATSPEFEILHRRNHN